MLLASKVLEITDRSLFMSLSCSHINLLFNYRHSQQIQKFSPYLFAALVIFITWWYFRGKDHGHAISGFIIVLSILFYKVIMFLLSCWFQTLGLVWELYCTCICETMGFKCQHLFMCSAKKPEYTVLLLKRKPYIISAVSTLWASRTLWLL